MEYGAEFKKWVYPIYAEIFASLTPEMQEQVEADKYGNLVELFENIDLALRRTEVFSTSELKKKFFGLTMEKDGGQNVMKFLAEVKKVVARLEKAGAPPNNKDIMEVMKLGINQDIFESIVDMADNNQYKTH